jgi:hypothetical protein
MPCAVSAEVVVDDLEEGVEVSEVVSRVWRRVAEVEKLGQTSWLRRRVQVLSIVRQKLLVLVSEFDFASREVDADLYGRGLVSDLSGLYLGWTVRGALVDAACRAAE